MFDYDKILILELAITNFSLTTKSLKEKGFSSRDLTKYVKDGFLIRVGRGVYEIEVSYLNDYIVTLLKSGDIKKSLKGLKLSLSIAPDNFQANYLMAITFLGMNKYEEAFPYLEAILSKHNSSYITECIYIVYLLSFLVPLPTNLKNISSFVDFPDVSLNILDKNQDYDYYLMLDKIRKLVVSKQFKEASLRINNLLKGARRELVSFTDLIEADLISKIANLVDLRNSKIKEFFELEDFLGLVNYLTPFSKQNVLDSYSKMLLKLVKDYLYIKETGKIIEIKDLKENSLEKAIFSNNYELSLELLDNKKENSYLRIILEKIISLKKRIKSKEPLKEEITPSEPENTRQENIQGIMEKSEVHDIFKVIMELLLKEDYAKARSEIITYLDKFNLGYLNFLIFDLYKIDLLKHDFNFSSLKKVFFWILEPNFFLPFRFYMKELFANFYKNPEVALLYLNIFQKVSALLLEKGYDFKNESVIPFSWIKKDDIKFFNPSNLEELKGEIISIKGSNTSNLNNHSKKVILNPNLVFPEEDYYYGMINILEIADFLDKHHGNLELLMKEFNLTREDIDVIILIYAREYYREGLEELGDIMLKRYEKSPYKTFKTITFYERLKVKKRCYLNKPREDEKRISLKVFPK